LHTTAAARACEEKDHLSRAYGFAASDYVRAAALLNKRTGVMSKQDYEEIRTYAEKVRDLAEQARIALERHIAEHGC
jgi:hypothetical protein